MKYNKNIYLRFDEQLKNKYKLKKIIFILFYNKKEHFLDKMKELKSKKFTDEIFPPTINSLVPNPKKSKSPLLDYKSFYRIPEIYPEKKLIISKTIDPNDIQQGVY